MQDVSHSPALAPTGKVGPGNERCPSHDQRFLCAASHCLWLDAACGTFARVQDKRKALSDKARQKMYDCRDTRVLEALDAMRQNKQAQEMSARIQPKHDATFKSAGRVGGAAIAAGTQQAHSQDVLARRRGDKFTQGVLGDVKLERSRIETLQAEKRTIDERIRSDVPAEEPSKPPDLAGWRHRLLSRAVKSTRGKSRFLQDSAAPLVDADLLRGQLKRDPESFTAIGDVDTVERMLDVLDVNSGVASLRAVHAAHMQVAQHGIDDMWQAAKSDKERETVQSAYAWRKKYNMHLTQTQRLQLEMFMPDEERIARDRRQRKQRLRHWADLVGGEPVVDVDAAE